MFDGLRFEAAEFEGRVRSNDGAKTPTSSQEAQKCKELEKTQPQLKSFQSLGKSQASVRARR